jgi:2'-5' RNA ligase
MAHIVRLFYQYREKVLAVGNLKATAAWNALRVSCPELIHEMEFNTFKTHFAAFVTIMELVNADAVDAAPVPKTFMGWSVQTGKDGYIRLYKSFQGQVKSLYIGKTWNPEKAERKIAETASNA